MKKHILSILGIFYMVFLLTAFAEWNLNPAQWEKETRIEMALIGVAAFVATTMINAVYNLAKNNAAKP